MRACDSFLSQALCFLLSVDGRQELADGCFGFERISMTEYFTGTEFEVTFDMVTVSFSKVTNIGGSIEVESYAEGGRNSSPIYFQKPKRRPETIVFEKGMNDSFVGSVFSLLKEGSHVLNVMIMIKNNGKLKRVLSFNDGLVLSKRITCIDAMSNKVLIERLEMAHSGLFEVPIPI